MAYNKILLKRRATAGGTPSIDYGELAWNQVDEKLYIGTNTTPGSVKVLAGEGAFLALNPAGSDQTLAQSITIGASPTVGSGVSHYLYFKQEGESAAGTRIYQTGGDLTVGTHNGSTWTDRFKVKDGSDLVWANNGFETGNIQISDDADGGKLVATGTNGGIKLVTTLAGKVIIDADSAGGGVQIDAGIAGVDINSAGTVSIDATGASKDVTITSNNSAVVITGKKGGAAAVKLHASNTDAATTLDITSAGTGASAIDINSAGGVDIDATTKVTVDGTAVEITGTQNTSGAVAISASGTTGNATLTLHSAGTVTNAIDIDSLGGIDIDAVKDINLASTLGIILDAAENAADAVVIKATGTNGGVNIDSKTGGVTVGSTGGVVKLESDKSSATAVQILADGTSGGVKIDSKTGGVTVGSIGGTVTLTSDTAVAITSSKVGSEAVKISATGAGASSQVEITSVGTNDTSTIGSSPILLAATSGGIGLEAAKDITLDATAKVLIKSASNLGEAIYLHANAGTNETIKIHSDQGTGASSIELTSDAGGVDINAGTTVSIDSAGAANLTSSAGAVTLKATTKSVFISGGENTASAVRINASHADGGIDIDSGSKGVIVDTTGAISLDASTSSNFTSSAGNITIDGKTGINLAANGGTNAIEIASDGDIAFKATSGTNTNPDFSVAGYAIFSDALEVDNIKIDGNTITSINVDGAINITPNGTGSVVISKVDINSGTIDESVITGGTASSLVTSRGNTDVALTGTVAVTSGSATVNGTGTSFSSEIAAGDSIKIDSVVYDVDSVTSNAVLVLSANASTSASGATATKDSYLFRVKTGFGTDKLVIDKSGNVDIKTGTLTVAGDLTVNGTTTTVNSTVVQIDDNVLILGEDGTPLAATTSDFGVSWARATGPAGGPFVRTYGGLVWDESTDQVIISDDLGATAPGSAATINSYANFRADHLRIGSDTINRDVQWQKVYDEIWASAIGDSSGVPDSITSAMEDKFLMVKKNGSVGSYTYDFEMTDTIDGGTW
jgi:hypothetical protein